MGNVLYCYSYFELIVEGNMVKIIYLLSFNNFISDTPSLNIEYSSAGKSESIK